MVHNTTQNSSGARFTKKSCDLS